MSTLGTVLRSGSRIFLLVGSDGIGHSFPGTMRAHVASPLRSTYWKVFQNFRHHCLRLRSVRYHIISSWTARTFAFFQWRYVIVNRCSFVSYLIVIRIVSSWVHFYYKYIVMHFWFLFLPRLKPTSTQTIRSCTISNFQGKEVLAKLIYLNERHH